MKVRVTLNNDVRKCDHCGAKNIKRTFGIQINKDIFYIGRMCVTKITSVNTSGNPHYALARVQAYLDTLDADDIYNLVLGDIDE